MKPKMRSALSFGGPFVAAAAILLTQVPGAALAKPRGGVSHTATQTPPIQLGTSGGWRSDLANGYCCGGTLGALVDVGGRQYVLSNWHVFQSDIVLGGNGVVARYSDPVIQPGLIDVGCSASDAQTVAYLSSGSPSLAIVDASGVRANPNVNVDAAIAAVALDALGAPMVSGDGAILEVGVPASTTVEAFPQQPVKKSGRTTRLTRSKVVDIYATVNVAYEDECAGSAAFTKQFVNQILIANRGSRFLAGGDSGSLLFEDVASGPRAVGLLFAGSSSVAVANPIDEVLGTIVRNFVSIPELPPPTATIVGGASSAEAPAPSAGLQAAVSRARAAQLRHRGRLESVPDATGHAIGLDRLGRVVIKVLIEADSPRARAGAPRSLDGVPVVVEAVGRIIAY